MVGSEVQLLVTSRTYNDADSGTYGQYIPGQDLSEAVTGSTKVKLIQLTKSSRFRTNVGFFSRTYNDLGSSTFGQYIPGYPAGTSIKSGELMRLVQLSHSTDSEAGFRSNIGLTSTAAVPITVTIYLYAQSGAYLGSGTVDLAPYSYMQENIFAAVSAEDLDSAYALIHSGTLEAGYFAYASVVDNRSGDPVFIPAR